MAEPHQAIPVVRSPSYQDCYSNQQNIQMSAFDATIHFSKNVTFAGNNVAEELVSVRMSPQALKVLSETLTNATAAWEAEFGTIETKEIPIAEVNVMRKSIQVVKDALRAMRATQTSPAKK